MRMIFSRGAVRRRPPPDIFLSRQCGMRTSPGGAGEGRILGISRQFIISGEGGVKKVLEIGGKTVGTQRGK